MRHIESWLRADVEGFTTGADWYVGRPLIVTENDYGLDLYNGDIGVVVEAEGGRLVAAFERRGTSSEVSPDPARRGRHRLRHDRPQEPGLPVPTRWPSWCPSLDSRVLTRELLYTAVTRARERLILVGAEELDPGRHRAADHPGIGAAAGPVGRGGLTGRLSRLELSAHAIPLRRQFPAL